MIDKPAGWTSHQVVGKVRQLAGTRKVGHAGTLDPMATGVLVIGIGKATRLLGHLALTEKAYDATIRLGVSTVTDDADGEVTETAGARGVTDYQIEARLQGFAATRRRCLHQFRQSRSMASVRTPKFGQDRMLLSLHGR